MSFFRRDGNTPTEELRLKDFDRIWTKFCFLDETGSLDDAKDPYFTIGLLKMSQPYYMQSKILYERNIRNFQDGFRNKNFNIFVERGGGENEKRQSS